MGRMRFGGDYPGDTEVIMVGDVMVAYSTTAWIEQQFGRIEMPDGRLKKEWSLWRRRWRMIHRGLCRGDAGTGRRRWGLIVC